MKRTPSAWRNLLEVRVRRLAGTKPVEVRRQALTEIRDLAQQALEQLARK